jgi:hypothetical protein
MTRAWSEGTDLEPAATARGQERQRHHMLLFPVHMIIVAVAETALMSRHSAATLGQEWTHWPVQMRRILFFFKRFVVQVYFPKTCE